MLLYLYFFFFTTVNVEEIVLTVPEETVNGVGAKVHWVVPNHSQFADSTFILSLRMEVTRTLPLVDQVKHLKITSDRGSTVFKKLWSSTTYHARLHINPFPFPGRPRPVTKISRSFQTQG